MNQEEHTVKAIGQFRLTLHGVFEPFSMYGLAIHIPDAEQAIIDLALRLHRRLNGEDIPINGYDRRTK